MRPLRGCCLHCGVKHRVRRGLTVVWGAKNEPAVELFERPEEVERLDSSWLSKRKGSLYTDDERTSIPTLHDARALLPAGVLVVLEFSGSFGQIGGKWLLLGISAVPALTYTGLYWRKALSYRSSLAAYRLERREVWSELERL